ncbi:MAG: dimethylsulfoxide reductase subunit B [Chloroflexi bacterium]|nr:dimethylsulfoxide reductase subunit B [Chloroflexota bacterium]
MTKQLAFHINTSACTGCKACAIACKDKNNLPVGIRWRRVYNYGGGGWVADAEHKDLMIPNRVFAYSVSFACGHCTEPECVKICPTGAMTKNENGIVTVNSDLCIGCRYCEWACPYDAPQFNEATGVMSKCNMCEDLLAEGQNPACVDACPMRAIEVGELEELQAKYGTLDAVEPMPAAGFTKPAVVVTPHRDAEMVGMGTGRILNLSEEI